jgi:hypothetical protein
MLLCLGPRRRHEAREKEAMSRSSSSATITTRFARGFAWRTRARVRLHAYRDRPEVATQSVTRRLATLIQAARVRSRVHHRLTIKTALQAAAPRGGLGR